ncbi:MAG: alpha/beta fold hydrolase [Anaerolineaceae bacterium]|nr:alpha/beta fold hydrolase [Anaerolineaceae bacterium]
MIILFMLREKTVQHKAILKKGVILIWVMVSAVACITSVQDEILPTPVYSIQKYTPTVTSTVEPTLTPTATINPLVTLTPTPDPFVDFYIESLEQKNYGGGVLQDEGNLFKIGRFTRKLFKYRSEGLDLYGFIDIPEGEGPFPIIILLHGAVERRGYRTVSYSARYADALAEGGYIAIHPNLRGYAPSQDGENILGIGDTIDLLNLLELVRQQSGSAGLLEKADGSRIGLWGHSMGGGIVMRALIIDHDIKAGLLYAPIHSNEEFNLSHFEKDGRGNEKVIAPASALAKMSPSNYLGEITVPISIHHGNLDDVIPIEWSRDLCRKLTDLGIEVQCVEYPDQQHTFQNDGDAEFMRNMLSFFDEVVK